VSIIEDGIYPYSGDFFNKKTKEKVSPIKTAAFRRAINAKKDGLLTQKKLRKNKRNYEGINQLINNADLLAKQIGFENSEEAESNLVPVVPNEIVELCKYCKVFKNQDSLYDLRPMMYVYWS
jgi:hypothetical protein